MQHALLDADSDAFQRDAALFAFEDAMLRDQFVALDAVCERKVAASAVATVLATIAASNTSVNLIASSNRGRRES